MDGTVSRNQCLGSLATGWVPKPGRAPSGFERESSDSITMP